MNSKKSILLHTCCAPCSAHVIKLLETYDVSVFYYNPNIDCIEEYEKRKNECQKYCEKKNIPFIEYFGNPEEIKKSDKEPFEFAQNEWSIYIEGLEKEAEGGARCSKCFKMRLAKTAEFARKHGFDNFATTLSISPHKSSDLINKVGSEVEKKYKVSFLENNWKTNNGYKESCEISRKEGFYRQSYCGCKYSRRTIENKGQKV